MFVAEFSLFPSPNSNRRGTTGCSPVFSIVAGDGALRSFLDRMRLTHSVLMSNLRMMRPKSSYLVRRKAVKSAPHVTVG